MKKYQIVYLVKRKRLAMLDLLIAAQQDGQIDEQGINEKVDTFMLEGHETSAMGICFALLLLAEHKDVQARTELAPNKFGSDRFLPERIQNDILSLTFHSALVRATVLDKKFATMELKAVIDHSSQNFYLDCTCFEKRLIQEIKINYTLDFYKSEKKIEIQSIEQDTL